MATYIPYTPTGAITKAMFNFDAGGTQNYVLSGLIRVSVSDGFSVAEWFASGFNSQLILGFDGEVPWNQNNISNIQSILTIYSQFANLNFSTVSDFDVVTYGSTTFPTANPQDVGFFNGSDINITLFDPGDSNFLGVSGVGDDSLFDYVGGAGDIFINPFGSAFNDDLSFGDNTRAKQTLMHELGHSLGLSHPFSSIVSGIPTITADFAVLMNVGFNQLGFRTNSAADMNKEYFTIMSYDEQSSVPFLNAYTPMILDVIALGQTYGEGSGTSGAGNDTIVAGNIGYRTYFDTGGVDKIDASLYTDGAYLNMGVSITDANHLVGVLMSLDDGINTIINAGDPFSLRWFYGEYENASGSISADFIVGNSLANNIEGLSGNDIIMGNGGADIILGGDGNDTVIVTHDDGNDTLSGGSGFDLLDFSAVNGVIQINQLGGVTTGSAGNDIILDVFEQVQGTNFNDVLSGGHGGDVLDGGGGNDMFFGNNGDDLMRGEPGDDTFFFSNSDGNDRLLGGDGWDTLDYSSLNGVVQVNQLAGTTTGTAGNDILLDTFEMVIGTAYDDVLSGGHGPNTLKGGGGNDQIFANNGDDYISGGTGNDRTTFGTGNDTLDFRNGENVDTITDFVAGAGSDDTITLKFYSGLGTTTLAGLGGRVTQNGAHTEITLNDGDMVILENVVATSLHENDFVFV